MENKDLEKKDIEPAAEEQEIIVYGKAAIDGVALPSQALERATEDFPIVLMVGEDFIPVKAGDEIKTPYDAVLPMEEIQKIGPMIRVIRTVEPMTNVEAL
ncbi:MAG: hypothetical protein IJC41_00095 [Firmicutes bacterium]|nr:hypothetical protein [Clostridiales bacterium]MBQ4339386.1 hypothetical protein [Bacillota bacterium]